MNHMIVDHDRIPPVFIPFFERSTLNGHLATAL